MTNFWELFGRVRSLPNKQDYISESVGQFWSVTCRVLATISRAFSNAKFSE